MQDSSGNTAPFHVFVAWQKMPAGYPPLRFSGLQEMPAGHPPSGFGVAENAMGIVPRFPVVPLYLGENQVNPAGVLVGALRVSEKGHGQHFKFAESETQKLSFFERPC